MRSSSDWETCFHEAGHAVVAVALHQKFGYVSMRPRNKKLAVAHVWTPGHIPAYAIYQRGHWKAYASISAAGIIAEELHMQEDYLFDSWDEIREPMRRSLVRDSGRTDLKNVRKFAWHAWSRARESGPHWSATWVDPTHSPVDLAVSAWRTAAVEIAVHWEAIEAVAEVLYDSPRKVSYREIREIVDDIEPDFEVHDRMPDEYLEPWFLEHSRLKWMPSDSWFADVERYAEMRRRHEAEVAARCPDCGCTR